MDEGKSYKGLIAAYGGVGVVVVAIGIFIARGVSHNDMIVMRGGATATPLVVGVYNGIRPDATATPAPAAAPTTSPTPGPSQSPSPHPSASAKSAESPKPVEAIAHKTVKHKHRLLAEAQSDRSSDAADGGAQGGPIEHADRPAAEATAPPLVATSEPAAAPTVAPAPVAAAAAAAAAAEEDKPVFAPERVVDAQVRNAVQPDYSEMDRERGAHGTSVVLVTIDPKGQVVSASIGSSSGFPSLDRSAIAAARASTFVAPKINGRPATETYRLVYDF